jgi:hypothetical protein
MNELDDSTSMACGERGNVDDTEAAIGPSLNIVLVHGISDTDCLICGKWPREGSMGTALSPACTSLMQAAAFCAILIRGRT